MVDPVSWINTPVFTFVYCSTLSVFLIQFTNWTQSLPLSNCLQASSIFMQVLYFTVQPMFVSLLLKMRDIRCVSACMKSVDRSGHFPLFCSATESYQCPLRFIHHITLSSMETFQIDIYICDWTTTAFQSALMRLWKLWFFSGQLINAFHTLPSVGRSL